MLVWRILCYNERKARYTGKISSEKSLQLISPWKNTLGKYPLAAYEKFSSAEVLRSCRLEWLIVVCNESSLVTF